MKDTEFDIIDPLLEVADDIFNEFLDSPGLDDLKRMMQKVAAELPDTMSINLNLNVEVFDRDREQSLNLLGTTLTTGGDAPPYRSTGDATVQRYLVEGEICQLPHDHCPVCWGGWAFKDRHRTCPNCACSLGKEVKILLDSDVCPHCEKGKVSMTNPVCSDCGYEVDLDVVSWG